nr:LysR family transcriptional regulator [uncultured Cohaesibacter sp.]
MDTLLGMRTFCAVVNEGSFIKGAESLDMSAALASKYVGQLEERLGVRLLNRTTRSMALTEAGQDYFAECAQLINDFDMLEKVTRDRQATPVGHLRISAPVSFGQDQLTEALAAFLKQHPGISIETKLTDRFVNIVNEGYDMAIRIGKLEDSSLIARKLLPISMSVFAAPDYLAAHGTPQSPDDLRNHQCIIDINHRSRNNWQFETDEGTSIIGVKGRYVTDSADSCRRMALCGLGIGCAPSFVVEDDIKAGTLVPLLTHLRPSEHNLYALYPHSRHVATKVRLCVDFLASYFTSVNSGSGQQKSRA